MTDNQNGDMLSDALWIWLDQPEVIPNHYACFRKVVTLPHCPPSATVRIAVDSDFVLYLNGAEAARGQFSDYPARKTYTEVEVAPLLRQGTNVVAVLAYFRGENFSTYRTGKPGLIVALQADDMVVVSDGAWKARQSPAFQSGLMPKVTLQLTFTACYDARQDDDWLKIGYNDAGWARAKAQAGATDGFWQELLPRPAPTVRIGSAARARLVGQGDFWRKAEGQSFAETMARDALAPRCAYEIFDKAAEQGAFYGETRVKPIDYLAQPDGQGLNLLPPEGDATGRYLIIDVGGEETGLLTLHLTAPAATVLDIAHGEHLDDGRVRMHVGGRNFADRYICAEGANRFTLPFHRLGLRYLEVHLSNFSAPVWIDYIGILPTHLDIVDQGGFTTPDPLANRTYAIGKRTLQLCMHEHYEDCPWREQALYAGDGRNQALYGYYAFGNYAFAEASFDLLGRGMRDDGLLELCAPARVSVNIPYYTFEWICALADHWLFSGSSALFDRFAGPVATIIGACEQRFDPATGLYRGPADASTWNLYDWMYGLAGKCGHDDPGERLDAPYNLFYHEALGAYSRMLHQAGRAAEAQAIDTRRQALGQAIYRIFWHAGENALAAYAEGGKITHFTDLAQMLGLLEGVIPEVDTRLVLENLFAHRFHPLTLYTLLYQARALRFYGPAARAFTAQTMAKHWDAMVFAGATSFWETDLGGDDFAQAGSLCHGWSALPVYYYQAWVLGVHPLEPGFARFAICPYPDRFASAAGRIPTPVGPIQINWSRRPEGLVIEAEGPGALTAEIAAYPEAPVFRATYNGQLLHPALSQR